MTISFPAGIPAKAKDVWDSSIQAFGREVSLRPNDGSPEVTGIKAFCKRPKILGLFDRTEQSYDQTRYMVMLRAEDVPGTPAKFDRVRWDNQDHAVISVTEIDLGTGVFGYRFLVKG